MSKMKAVIVSSPSMIESVYGNRLDRIAELCDLDRTIYDGEKIMKADLSDVELLFSTWGMVNLTEEEWAKKMPNLKAVFYAAGATDSFCRPLLARGVKVISAWQANSIPVAEFTVSQIILGLKNYFQMTRAMKSPGGWQNRSNCSGAYGETVVLLGAGAISTRVQNMLKNYALNVIVVPSRPERRTISLEEAFKTAKVVSCHLPNRDDNVGVLNGKLFSSMRKGAVFINTGRGRQVNEKELCEVLSKRPDLSALLDVTCPEPPEKDSPLYTLPNVFLTPHIAGSLNDEFKRMADYVIAELERYLRGEKLQYQVSEDMLLTSK